jgi:alkaline phosphatase
MTKIAIAKLSQNPNGFFLLVEGSQIDWAGHENDIVGAMSEMADFEAAIAEGLSFAKTNDGTQLIVTADHSTGGLSVGASVNGNDYYQWNSQVVKSFKLTPNKIMELAQSSGDLLTEFEKATDLELGEEDKKRLKSSPVKDYYRSLKVITDIINEHSYTGWTTQGHTGVDVNLYAYGPASAELVGNWDNTKLAEFMFSLLQP